MLRQDNEVDKCLGVAAVLQVQGVGRVSPPGIPNADPETPTLLLNCYWASPINAVGGHWGGGEALGIQERLRQE